MGILVPKYFKNFNFMTAIYTTLKLQDPKIFQLSKFYLVQ
jgi:hypothetical protein